MIKHYIEFFYPGVIFSETSINKVKSRCSKSIKAPTDCFGFRFFDREEVKSGREILKGNNKNYSGVYYFGKIYNLNQIRRKFPTEKILIRNVARSKNKKAVKTRLGNWQMLYRKDRIIKEK